MLNFLLFVVSIACFHAILFALPWHEFYKRKIRAIFFLSVILCIPFRVGDDVYTVFGSNVNKEGGVFSFASLIQKGKNTGAFIAEFQEAQNNAGAGFVGWQEAQNEAGAVFALWQDSQNIAVAKLVMYQRALNEADALFAGYHSVGEKGRAFALLSIIKAEGGEKEE